LHFQCRLPFLDCKVIKLSMASPQKESGYTAIANEILEALARVRLNSDCWKLLMVIFRKTYGFNKKRDKISLSQFALATQLTKSVVCRGLNRLKNMNIIIRIANDECTIYEFNKDFDTWKPLAKLLTLAKQQTIVSSLANASLAKQRHTKYNTTKDTITKDILTKVSRAKAQPREDINTLLDKLTRLLGALDESKQKQRWYAKLFIDSKTPEILALAGNTTPTKDQIINATLRIFQLAMQDSFHQKNCRNMRYVYNKSVSIITSQKTNKPKVATIPNE